MMNAPQAVLSREFAMPDGFPWSTYIPHAFPLEALDLSDLVARRKPGRKGGSKPARNAGPPDPRPGRRKARRMIARGY